MVVNAFQDKTPGCTRVVIVYDHEAMRERKWLPMAGETFMSPTCIELT